MTLLQIFFIISGIIIFISALDIARKERFNALHFLVFLLVGGGLLVFTFFPSFLDTLGHIFGLQRGADALVYTSIVFIFYFILLLLRKSEENKSDVTDMVRELAIATSKKQEIHGESVFLIRVYNEAPVLDKTLNSLIESGVQNILVIDDGSRDGSTQILEKYSDKIIILKHLKNRGGGAALKTGFEYIKLYGKTKYVVTFDADGQHNINDYIEFHEAFSEDKDLDIVLGSRFTDGAKSNMPLARRILLKFARIFTFLVSHLAITDSHNGFRMIKSEVLHKIHLHMDGMEYASELLDSIKKNKLKYKEVPVQIHYSDYSLRKGQKSSDAIGVGIRFIWSKFFR